MSIKNRVESTLLTVNAATFFHAGKGDIMKTVLLLLFAGLLGVLPSASYGEPNEAAEEKKPEAGLRYSISVSKFQNEAGWRGRWDIGDGFTTIMTDALHESGRFIVLGDAEMRREAMREQDLGASGRTAQGARTPQTGHMTPAQLLVRGSITHVQETTGGTGGVRVRGLRLGGSTAQSEVNITIYLVDSMTGQVKASTNVTGISNRRGVAVGYYGPRGVSGEMGGFLNDNVGKACQDAVAQAVEFLSEQVGGIQWQGTVILADDDRVIINRGTREGVKKGMRFKAGTEEKLFDPDTGELLHVSISRAGEIEVYEVLERISYARPTDGAGLIKKDMIVLPL